MKGCKGIMSAIDFEKAFDSRRLDFLFKSLEILGYRVSFITWIRTFYKNMTSRVVNNGFFPPSFHFLNEEFARVILHRHLFYYSSRIFSNFHSQESSNKRNNSRGD